MKSQNQIAVLWVVAVTIAGAIVGLLEGSFFQFGATLIFTGLILGIGQWLVLRRVGMSWHWMVATASGWVFGTFVTMAIPIGGIANSLAQNVGMWEVFWLNLIQMPFWVLLLAIGQWWLLRNYKNAWLWILFTLIGGMVQGGISSIAASWDVFSGAINTAFIYGLGWFAYGIITAIGLYVLNVGQQKKRVS